MADYTGGNLDMLNVGGRGGLGGSGIWDIIALGLVTGGGFLGNDRKDNCGCPPATCKDVWAVDKDVLQGTNEIGEEICEATHDIETAIGVVGDKVTSGFYALNDKVTSIAYAQQAATEAIKNKIDVGNTAIIATIKEVATNQEVKAQAAVICAQNEEINRFKIIAALKHCGGHSDDKSVI